MPDDLTPTAGTHPSEPTRTREERIDAALDVIHDFGSIDGGHHKQWVLDQVVRALSETNDDYLAWVACVGEWDEGIAP